MRMLTLDEFVQAADPDGLGIFLMADRRWQARCRNVALRCPSTGLSTFDDLHRLLGTLAGAGIRCSRIEWDGMPALPYEQEAATQGSAEDNGLPEIMHLHPAETALFVAAALRRLVLSIPPGGEGYTVDRNTEGGLCRVASGLSFKEVANLCGATGTTTLRQAAERDGLAWPDSPEALVAVYKNLSGAAMTGTTSSLPAPAAAAEILDILHSRPAPVSTSELAALRRLVAIARGDTGQSRRVADFLLAWWNAGTCGGFDMTNLWAVDTTIANDMVTVFGLVARISAYPDTHAPELQSEFEGIVRAWHPELD